MNDTLDTLTDFTVIPEYHRNRTLYYVRPHGASDPVARLHADRSIRAVFRAFTGPGLDQQIGLLNGREARTNDGDLIGMIHSQRHDLRKDEWAFAQTGLAELRGTLTGASGAVRNIPLAGRFVTDNYTDAMMPLHLRFTARGCRGFEITRPPAFRARYRVRVHDERISRLLVLSIVVRYDLVDDQANLPRDIAIAGSLLPWS